MPGCLPFHPKEPRVNTTAHGFGTQFSCYSRDVPAHHSGSFKARSTGKRTQNQVGEATANKDGEAEMRGFFSSDGGNLGIGGVMGSLFSCFLS